MNILEADLAQLKYELQLAERMGIDTIDGMEIPEAHKMARKRRWQKTIRQLECRVLLEDSMRHKAEGERDRWRFTGMWLAPVSALLALFCVFLISRLG